MSGRRRREGSIHIAGENLAYVLQRVPRRRHVHVLVHDDARVEVRGPCGLGVREAEALIRSHGDWIQARLLRVREARARRPALATGVELPLLDERLRLEVRRTQGGRGRVARDGVALTVLSPRDCEPALRALLEDWYRREAHRRLPSRLWELGAQAALRPSAVSIRAQRTRWGSCSARGTISLNWRLMLLPSCLADYVLVHELCHLRHLDHSPRFWALVERLLPDWRERRARLRVQGASLAL